MGCIRYADLSFGFVANIHLASFTYISGVQRVECKSALYQGQSSLLTMHHPVHAEKWAKGTRLYLGLIGAWKGPTEELGGFP